jgi:hypothetical protein
MQEPGGGIHIATGRTLSCTAPVRQDVAVGARRWTAPRNCRSPEVRGKRPAGRTQLVCQHDGKVGYTAVTFTPAETRRGSPPPPHGGTADVGPRTALSAGVPARTPVNGRHDFFARAQPLGHSEGNCAMVKSIPRISRELRITAARGPLETDSVPLYPTSTDYSALGCIERERRRFRRPSPFACVARS